MRGNTMTNYVCKYGLWHHKPCKDNEPSSNNGWIYTAYARVLGENISNETIRCTFHSCFKTHYLSILPFTYIVRLPHFNINPSKKQPPISRDELIGMASLFRANSRLAKELISNDWYFFGHKLNTPLWDSLKAAWKIRKEGRNYYWENEIDQIYPLAFTLWHHDRYYMKKMFGAKPNLFEWTWFHIYMLWELSVAEPHRLNLLWLQLKDLNSKFWIRFINPARDFEKVFGAEHPFSKALKDK